MTRERSAVFVVTFRPTVAGIDPIRALRAVLKFALRRFGLKAISAREILDRASPEDSPGGPGGHRRVTKPASGEPEQSPINERNCHHGKD
jgi:hypothetical protein